VKRILPFLILAAAVPGFYAPAARNGFVWDDTALILRDPLIRSWRLIPEGFQHFLFTDATASDFYRPIQRLSYTLEYAAVGFQPAMYHGVSIVCHLVAAIALLLFANELLRAFDVDERLRRNVSSIAVIVWAIHPIHTGAVAYISGRADSLAAMFGFAGVYLGLRSMRAAGGRLWIFLGAAALSLLLSALGKEAGLIFLAVLVVIPFVQRNWKISLRAAIAVLAVLVVYASLRLPAEHTPTPSRQPIPLLVRPILFSRAIAEYTGLIFFPLDLHMDRDVATHPFGFSNASMGAAAWRELQTLAGIVLLAGFVYWLLRERKRDRAIFLCLLLTALSYLPVSGMFPLNATIAEHWLYFPSAFFLLALALAAVRFFEARSERYLSSLALSVLALWTIFLGVRTVVRTDDWKDQRTFLERTITNGGDSARMLINLGGLELKEGRLDEAKRHLEAALQKEPEQPLAVLNLAAVAVEQSDFKVAHDLLARAVQMPLVKARAYELMAVLENRETGQSNLMRMRLASRTGPPNWSIEKRYVKLLDELGGTEAAIAEVKHCLATQWYRAETWQMLSELLEKASRGREAAEASAQARRYDVWLGDDKGSAVSTR